MRHEQEVTLTLLELFVEGVCPPCGEKYLAQCDRTALQIFAHLKCCFVLTSFTESGTLHSHSVGSVLMSVGGEPCLLAKLLSHV